jgi:hypothetical protein
MPQIKESNRDLWVWLLNDGGAWTAHDIAKEVEREVDDVFNRLAAMAAKGFVVKLPPANGSRRLRYAVTGTCRIPFGMRVAEVQAE